MSEIGKLIQVKLIKDEDVEETLREIANKIPKIRELFNQLVEKEEEEIEINSEIDSIEFKIKFEENEEKKKKLETKRRELEEKLEQIMKEEKKVKQELDKVEEEVKSMFDFNMMEVTYECVNGSPGECELENNIYPAIVVPIDADGVFFIDILPGLRIEVKFK